MFVLLSSVPEWQISLLIEAAGVCFSAGILVTTVRYLKRDVKDHKEQLGKHEEKLEQQGKAIEGLKVHTHYPGI